MPVTWCRVYGELVVLVVSLGNSSNFFQVIISRVSSPGTSQQTQTQLVISVDCGRGFAVLTLVESSVRVVMFWFSLYPVSHKFALTHNKNIRLRVVGFCS